MTAPPINPESGAFLFHLVWDWITAVISTNDRGVTALEVMATAQIHDTHVMRAPINEYLSNRCYTLDSIVEYDDPDLIDGYGFSTAYTVWPACPGTTPHACVGAA